MSWQVFSGLLDQALELPIEQRAPWLDSLGVEHEALKPALRAMLQRSAALEAGKWLNTLPHTASAVEVADESDLQPDALIGPYRLLRELGIGGMGTVWLAERADGNLKRQVALKLPRAIWSPGLAQRMARERDILASLEHPNIARLYDAGTDANGRPFLALEYVEGQPIDSHCRERALGIAERLRLLLQVADAVAFAHSRLVLHRDLKPSNVLVTRDGQVRLLDFGIAKLMEGSGAAEATELTRVGGRALTLRYASPEQMRGETTSTASDVYSLGVVAYEVLSGASPYGSEARSAAKLEEAINAGEVPPASSRCDDPAHRRQLKGDLDAILHHALNKQPAERYATVDALAADWRRHQRGESVTARPDRLGDRVARLVRRHRVPLAAAALVVAAFGLAVGAGATALVVLALLLGLGAALWQARRAGDEARRAQVEAQTANAVQEFLRGIFAASSGDQADPQRARQRTAIELLDEGAARVESELDGVPEAKFKVLESLAEIYDDLCEIRRCQDLRERCVALAERTWGERSPRLALALSRVAMSYSNTGRMQLARSALERAEAILAATSEADRGTRLAVDIAWAEHFRFTGDAAGLPLAERAVSLALQLPPCNDWLNALALLGMMQRLAGRLDDSAATFERAIALAPKVPGGALSIMGAIFDAASQTARERGDTEAAEGFLQQAIAVDTRIGGPDSTYTVTGLRSLAVLKAAAGESAAALAICADARDRLSRCANEGERLPTLRALSVREARILADHGHPARALALVEQAWDSFGGDAVENPSIATMLQLERSDLNFRLGRADDGERALAEAAEMARRFELAGERYDVPLTLQRARLALLRGRWADAGAGCDQVLASGPAAMACEALLIAAEAAWASGDRDRAAQLAVRALGVAETPPRPERAAALGFAARMLLGRCQLESGDAKSARDVLEQALALSRRLHDERAAISAVAVRHACAQALRRCGDETGASALEAEAQRLAGVQSHAACEPPPALA